jgi:preprotein translocase subunit SecG
MVLISVVLIGMVVIQGRTAGLQNRNATSIYTTKRGIEKTMHQATIVLAVVFLLLSLIASLPIFGRGQQPATGSVFFLFF